MDRVQRGENTLTVDNVGKEFKATAPLSSSCHHRKAHQTSLAPASQMLLASSLQ